MNSKNKNALIGGLLAIVFVMAVGYAAFAQQLTINGSASITSTWNVQMTAITKTGSTGTGADIPYASGTAENGTKLIDGATAQFRVDLQSPGDSVTYTVTVKNSGNINAKVSSIDFTKGANSDVIDFSYSGISTSTTIAAGATTTFTVKVTYVSTITSQPDDKKLSNTLTMHVNFVQA